MKIELIRSAHSVGESNFHFVFTPAYRRPVFKIEFVRKVIRPIFFHKAEELKVSISALEFGPDHLHLFLGNCKNYSVSKLAQEFKGFTSWAMRRTFSISFDICYGATNFGRAVISTEVLAL